MKQLTALGFVLLLSNNLPAAVLCSDTLTPKKPYKLSRQQFLDKYGKDDTARMVITYFFQQHKRAAKWVIPYLMLTAAGSVIYATAIVTGSLGVIIFLGTFVLLGTFIAGLLFLDSCIGLLKFPRKRLFRLLNNYYAGNGIPRRLKNNIYYQKWHY
jgi:hypothetical protein